MKANVRLKAGDFIVFAVIIAVACAIWIHLAMIQTNQTYGEIWVDGTLQQQIKLGDDVEKNITFDGRVSEVKIQIDGKQMKFIQSECYDHICEKTGWISKVGQTAVCLPNRVMIKITGNSTDNGVDAIVQ